eukprot:5993341-Pyramimonas_sp.AAC.4
MCKAADWPTRRDNDGAADRQADIQGDMLTGRLYGSPMRGASQLGRCDENPTARADEMMTGRFGRSADRATTRCIDGRAGQTDEQPTPR